MYQSHKNDFSPKRFFNDIKLTGLMNKVYPFANCVLLTLSLIVCSFHHRMYPRDPEGFTDGKDWTVHINDHFERREDGLCMDTISGSSKLRRKSFIPGEKEAVLQSMFKVKAPVMTSPNNYKDKQEVQQRTVGDTENTSPEVVQRSEYSWDKLLRETSGVKIQRSQTFHHGLPEYRTPMKRYGTTSSLNLDRDLERHRQKVRSKSLRGSNHVFSADETLPFSGAAVSEKSDNPQDQTTDTKAAKITGVDSKISNSSDKNRRVSRSGSAPSVRAKETFVKRENGEPQRQRSESLRWMPEPDYHSVSIEELVKSGQRINKKESLEKGFQHQDPDVCEESTKVATARKNKDISKNKQISRSGSAPSAQAKEALVKREADEPPRQRSVSHRWIPEPDYQSVSIEELVSATQPRNKCNKENNMCIVDVYSAPKNRDSKLSVPGVAQRMPIEMTTLTAQSREQSSGTVIEIASTDLDHNEVTPTEKNSMSDRAASLAASTNNSDIKPVLNLNEKPAAKDPRQEPVKASAPSFKKPSEVRSIGKINLVKQDETPPWIVNNARTLKHPIRENPQMGMETTLPTPNTTQLTEPTSTGNVSIIHTKAEPGQSTSELVKAALRNRTISNNNNNNNLALTTPLTSTGSFAEVQSDDVKITGLPKIKPDLSAAIEEYKTDSETNAPVTKDADIALSLEEKKKIWKREQMVDQLHSARQRNSNQNYIFGTGLAYQSCMPELQNKLKQLTLAK